MPSQQTRVGGRAVDSYQSYSVVGAIRTTASPWAIERFRSNRSHGHPMSQCVALGEGILSSESLCVGIDALVRAGMRIEWSRRLKPA